MLQGNFTQEDLAVLREHAKCLAQQGLAWSQPGMLVRDPETEQTFRILGIVRGDQIHAINPATLCHVRYPKKGRQVNLEGVAFERALQNGPDVLDLCTMSTLYATLDEGSQHTVLNQSTPYLCCQVILSQTGENLS